MKKIYVRRAMEAQLKEAAREFPAVVVTGPRQSGKTTLLRHLFSRHRYLSFDDPSLRLAAHRDPERFLEDAGDACILDEIQYAPQLLPHLKMAIDRDRRRNGRFLLTGSQVFALMQGVTESLAGRVALYELLGLSWGELSRVPQTVTGCYGRLFGGFYPETALHGATPRRFYESYVRSYLERDVRQIRNVHDIHLFQTFLELLAARAGSLLNLSEVGRDCGVSQPAARQWLSILESSRLVYLLRPYHRSLSKRVVKSPKVYFTDTGLLAHLLRYPDAASLASGPMAGAFFETMMVDEFLKEKWNRLRPYELYFVRDSNGNECDLLLDHGLRFDLIELKASKTLREGHGEGLRRLGPSFKDCGKYLLSFAEGTHALGGGVRALPWWDFGKVLARTPGRSRGRRR